MSGFWFTEGQFCEHQNVIAKCLWHLSKPEVIDGFCKSYDGPYKPISMVQDLESQLSALQQQLSDEQAKREQAEAQAAVLIGAWKRYEVGEIVHLFNCSTNSDETLPCDCGANALEHALRNLGTAGAELLAKVQRYEAALNQIAGHPKREEYGCYYTDLVGIAEKALK